MNSLVNICCLLLFTSLELDRITKGALIVIESRSGIIISLQYKINIMTQYNCIESTHNMTEWASIPTNSRIVKDPNRMVNRGERDQTK